MDGIDGADQQVARGYEAIGILEEFSQRAVLLDFRTEEWKEFVSDSFEHFVATLLLELRPAEVLFGLREDGVEILAEAGGSLFIPRLGEIEQAGEHEVRNLLDDGDRIRDPAGVEVEPEGIDFRFEAGSDGHLKVVVFPGRFQGTGAKLVKYGPSASKIAEFAWQKATPSLVR